MVNAKNRQYRKKQDNSLYTIGISETKPSKRKNKKSHKPYSPNKKNNINTNIVLSESEKTVHAMLSPTELENEQLVLIRQRTDGSIISFIQNSDKNSEIVTEGQKYAREAYRSVIDIHTHPNGTPFSPTDMWTYFSVSAIDRGEVVTGHAIYIVDKTDDTPAETSVDKEEFDRRLEASIRSAESEILVTTPDKYPPGSIAIGELSKKEMAIYILAMQKLAHAYKCKFHVIEKDAIYDLEK